RRFSAALRIFALASLFLSLLGPVSPAGAAPNDPPGYFSETGYRVGDAKFYEYFSARGGIRTFGYPVSRVFMLDGFKVQIFQRRVLHLAADGNVGQPTLLDQQYMPTRASTTPPSPRRTTRCWRRRQLRARPTTGKRSWTTSRPTPRTR